MERFVQDPLCRCFVDFFPIRFSSITPRKLLVLSKRTEMTTPSQREDCNPSAQQRASRAFHHSILDRYTCLGNPRSIAVPARYIRSVVHVQEMVKDKGDQITSVLAPHSYYISHHLLLHYHLERSHHHHHSPCSLPQAFLLLHHPEAHI